MNIKEKKRIKDFISRYSKNSDGQWLKRNCPTEGYLTKVVVLPGEANMAYNLLEELLNDKSN